MTAFPADTAPVVPNAFANSGEKVIRMPTTNQIGTPIRIELR
jgi:hypothetical protein